MVPSPFHCEKCQRRHEGQCQNEHLEITHRYDGDKVVIRVTHHWPTRPDQTAG